MVKKKVVTEEVSTEATFSEENQETKVVTEEVSTEATTGDEDQAPQEQKKEEPDPINAQYNKLEEAFLASTEEFERAKEQIKAYEGASAKCSDPLIATLYLLDEAKDALTEAIKQRKARKKPTNAFARSRKILSDTQKRLSAYVKN